MKVYLIWHFEAKQVFTCFMLYKNLTPLIIQLHSDSNNTKDCQHEAKRCSFTYTCCYSLKNLENKNLCFLNVYL